MPLLGDKCSPSEKAGKSDVCHLKYIHMQTSLASHISRAQASNSGDPGSIPESESFGGFHMPHGVVKKDTFHASFWNPEVPANQLRQQSQCSGDGARLP